MSDPVVEEPTVVLEGVNGMWFAVCTVCSCWFGGLYMHRELAEYEGREHGKEFHDA